MNMRAIFDHCNQYSFIDSDCYPFEANEVLRFLVQRIKATSDSKAFDENSLVYFAAKAMITTYRDIHQKFEGGNFITVYRAITAPANWFPEPNHRMGIYWSWDRDSAYPHMGDPLNSENRWLITARVARDQIDWFSTTVANAAPSTHEEREITIDEKAQSDLDVLHIEPQF